MKTGLAPSTTSRLTAPRSMSAARASIDAIWSMGRTSAGAAWKTVLPTLPSRALMAWASACTAGDWYSPGMTIDAPGLARRSATSGPIHAAHAPPAAPPSAASRARAKSSTSDGFKRRRWSAWLPMSPGALSTAYSRDIVVRPPSSVRVAA